MNDRKIDKDTNVPSTDCISRQAAIDVLRMDIDIIPFAKAREYARAVIETIYNRLEDLPTAQPERMRGRWMESETDGFVCSVCRNGYKNQPTCMGKPMFEFCPVCGARMDGGEA